MVFAYRYSEWDGTQEIPPLDPDDLLESLTDDLMNFGDLQHALRNLLQRGMRNPLGQRLQGLRDLLQQLRQQRRSTLDRYNLSSAFEDIERRLEEILEQERETLERRLQEALEQQQGPAQAPVPGRPAGGRAGQDQGAPELRVHGPRSPAQVPGADGDAEEGDDGDLLQGHLPADRQHVAGGAGADEADGAGPEPDAVGEDGGGRAGLRPVHAAGRRSVRPQPAAVARRADLPDAAADRRHAEPARQPAAGDAPAAPRPADGQGGRPGPPGRALRAGGEPGAALPDARYAQPVPLPRRRGAGPEPGDAAHGPHAVDG